jgi:hypothetical protein
MDGEIGGDEHVALMEHLNSCSRCNAMYAVFHDLSDILSEEPEPLPENLHENIMAGVRRSAMIRKNRRLRRFGLSTALSAAACAVLVLFAATGFNPAERAESVSIREQVIPAPPMEAESVPAPVDYAPPVMSAAPAMTPQPYAPAQGFEQVQTGTNNDFYLPPENTYTTQQPEYSDYNSYSYYNQAQVEAPPAVYPPAATPEVFDFSSYSFYETPVETPALVTQAEAAVPIPMSEISDAQTFEAGAVPLHPAEPEMTAAPDLSASLYAAPAEGGAAEEGETVLFSLSTGSRANFEAAPPESASPESAESPFSGTTVLSLPEEMEPSEFFTALTAPQEAVIPEEKVSVYGKENRQKLFAMIGSSEAELPSEAELTRVVHLSFVPEDSYGSEEKMDVNIYGDFLFCRYYPVEGGERIYCADCSLSSFNSFLDSCKAPDQSPTPAPTAIPFAAPVSPLPETETNAG